MINYLMKFNDLLKKWEEQNRTTEPRQLRLCGKVIKLRYQTLESGIILAVYYFRVIWAACSFFWWLFHWNLHHNWQRVQSKLGNKRNVSSISVSWKFDKQSSVWVVNFKQIKRKRRRKKKLRIPINSLIRRRSSGFLINSPEVGSLIGQIQTLKCI